MANKITDAHTTVEIEGSISSIATSVRKLISEFPPSSPNCCIFRAPKRYLELDGESNYHPLLVSIGPFHHRESKLKSMEDHKAAYLNAFLARCGGDNKLETCIAMIKRQEQEIRNCYGETSKLSSDDFVKMILLDSCFVIEIIRRCNDVDFAKKISDQLSHSRIAASVLDDMILLENQLPFFILRDLYNEAFPGNSRGNNDARFSDLCIQYLAAHLLSGDSDLAKGNMKNKKQSEIKHILDLLRMCQAPSISRCKPAASTKENSMCNATELKEAGMVIKQRWGFKSAGDILYTKGVLEIPKLMVHTSSERVLRNLIALELCLYSHESYITDYIHFMDGLIDTSNDVEILIRKGVVQSFSSDSNEVATLFNNLRPRILLRNYFYHDIQEDVNAYSKVLSHKYRAHLRRDYCSSPWIIISTIAAILLLVLTFIQAVCSIVSVT